MRNKYTPILAVGTAYVSYEGGLIIQDGIEAIKKWIQDNEEKK